MTSDYRFGDVPYSRRGGTSGRGSRPADSTLPQFSSYFALPREDVEHLPSSSSTQKPKYGLMRPQFNTTSDPLYNFVPAAPSPSLPSQTFLSTNRHATEHFDDPSFGHKVTNSDPEIPSLYSLPPNTAVRRQGGIPGLSTVPHGSRLLSLGDQHHRGDRLLEPHHAGTSLTEYAYTGRQQAQRPIPNPGYMGDRPFASQIPHPRHSPIEPQRQPWPSRSFGQTDGYNTSSSASRRMEHSQDRQGIFNLVNTRALEGQVSSSPTLIDSSPTARTNNRRQYTQQQGQLSHTQPAMSRSLPSSKAQAARGPPVVNGIRLISPKEAFPPKFHLIFPYEFLNAVQSKCFEAVYRTDDNVVVSAPTGCGKTAILDIAIAKLVGENHQEKSKIVYLAPTKALCKEKAQHWAETFGRVGLQVSEFTGDTARADMGVVRSSRIIVTTFEKWDGITRCASDHQRILSTVKLVLIDEVHFVKDPRGATLEVIVSRMKKRESKVRLIALSATIPNCEDIADWIGRGSNSSHESAHLECFGQEFRPVPLVKKVIAFPKKMEDHAFDNYLNGEIWKCLEQHTPGKATLIFCLSRRSCRATATTLADEWEKRTAEARLWPAPNRRIPVIDQELQHLVRYGVAFHHAGLGPDDKQAVENAFREGQLNVICCTTTLAVGVNTPCHTVVLKGTAGYQDGQLVEYSEMEVMQMLGRAGRPQFEKSALALILTKTQNKARFESLGSGNEVLESTLHRNLVEHLNSEIGLGTIRDMEEAKMWMKGTFFYRRLLKSPTHYNVTSGQVHDKKTLDQNLERICDTDMANLEETGMITSSVADGGRYIYRATDVSHAMAKYMIRFHSMKALLQIPQGVGVKIMLQHLCEAAAADELKEVRWQASDRDCAREVGKNSQFLCSVDPTGGVAQKLCLLVQMELGQIDCPSTMKPFDSQRFRVEMTRTVEVMNRLVRAVIECKASQQDGAGCSAALSLARSLSSKAWENGPGQLIQVPQVGKALMRKLVGSNIRTVADLADTPASTIERIASRNPPFGKKMTDALAWFPRLTIRVVTKATRVKGIKSLNIDATLGFSNTVGTPKWGSKIPIVTLLAHTSKGESTFFWRNSLRTFTHGRNTHDTSFSWTPKAVDEHLTCQFACEDIAGTLVTQRVSHDFATGNFPSPPEPSIDISQQVKVQRARSYHGLDEDISDNDLLFAIQEAPKRQPRVVKQSADGADPAISNDSFPQMDLCGNIEDPATRPSPRSRPSELDSDGMKNSEEQPVRLANGNFICGHPCSWATGGRTARGVQCGHQCCREGTKRPRKRNKTSSKRKPEDQGRSTSITSISVEPRDYAKRAKLTEAAPRPIIHSCKGEFPLDEDGLVDLTQAESFDSCANARGQTLDHDSSESGIPMDCDDSSMLQWSMEIPNVYSGNSPFDETLLEEGDDWTEFPALSPSRTSPGSIEPNVQTAADTEPAIQSVPPNHNSAVFDDNEKFGDCSHTDQMFCEAAKSSQVNATPIADEDETSADDGFSKRQNSFGEPEWINEIDSSLIDELRGIVDFV